MKSLSENHSTPVGLRRSVLPVAPNGRRCQHVYRALSEAKKCAVCRTPSACARRSDVREVLETLAALGHVGRAGDGMYAT